VTTVETATDAAVSGFGVTHLFCYQVSGAIAERKLDLVLREFEPAAFPVNLVYPGGRNIALKLRAFIDFVTPRLKVKLVFDP
jgi:DNA-binding transcriptional LysR family regulator